MRSERGGGIPLHDLHAFRCQKCRHLSIVKTNRCVTVEEGFPIGSIGNHLSAVIMERAFDYLDAPVINCTGKDVPMPYAANLEKLALTTTAEVISAVKKIIYK